MKKIKVEIKSYAVMASGNHSEKDKLQKTFDFITDNIKKFNGELLSYKYREVANGTIFEMYYGGNLFTDVSILSDKYGIEILKQNYRREG